MMRRTYQTDGQLDDETYTGGLLNGWVIERGADALLRKNSQAESRRKGVIAPR